MNLSHEGLSIWYGTPDAPAPGDDSVVQRRGASLVVGVHPASPSNSLVVRYRVDGGMERTLPGRELRTDFDRQVQYFGVAFPEFREGRQVEYLPVLGCVGRQVPAPSMVSRYPSKFVLGPALDQVAAPNQRKTVTPNRAPGGLYYTAGLDFVACVAVQFSAPQYLCDTAAGMRVNFFVQEGLVEGAGFKATVLAGSADNMLIRPDGMGEVHIVAAFATADGARLDVEASGYVDFGPDGYRRAVAHALPDRSAIVISPLISTRHPRYRWLSRVQCVGVGYTNLEANRASYSVYAASSRAAQ